MEEHSKDSPFRSDHMCLLAVSCLVIEVPDNMKKLLVYKQEPPCHANWVTSYNSKGLPSLSSI